MPKQRGTLSATPLKKAKSRPFLNLQLLRQKARLHRLVQKGLAPPGDKASLRAAGKQAVETFKKS
jgi:hypothetical protein